MSPDDDWAENLNGEGDFRVVRETVAVAVSLIDVPDAARPLSEKSVAVLHASMESIGMRAPIEVRPLGGRYELVSGTERFEAARRGGKDVIEAFVSNLSDYECLQHRVAENLHRRQLDPIDRALAIATWERKEAKKTQGVQDAQPGGKQPHDKRISKTAKALGTNRDEIRRAKKIARIKPKALAAARQAGLKKQSALLEIAAAPDEDTQLVKVADLVGRSKSAARVDNEQLRKLMGEYRHAKKLRCLIRQASPATRRRFFAKVEKDCAERGGEE